MPQEALIHPRSAAQTESASPDACMAYLVDGMREWAPPSSAADVFLLSPSLPSKVQGETSQCGLSDTVVQQYSRYLSRLPLGDSLSNRGMGSGPREVSVVSSASNLFNSPRTNAWITSWPSCLQKSASGAEKKEDECDYEGYVQYPRETDPIGFLEEAFPRRSTQDTGHRHSHTSSHRRSRLLGREAVHEEWIPRGSRQKLQRFESHTQMES